MSRTIAKVTITYKAPWIDSLHNFFEGLQPGGAVLRRALRRVMIYGLLRSIRKTFMSNLTKAMDLSVVAKTRNERRARLLQSTRTSRLLRIAYERLDDAVLSGNSKRADAARQRIATIERIGREHAAKNEHVAVTAGSGTRARIMSLSALTGALMRERAYKVLDLLTNPSYVQDEMRGDTFVVGSGRHGPLDSVKTPSATGYLTSNPTVTRYNVLWRHLEFGTGMYASRPNLPGHDTYSGGGRSKNADGTWWYGRSDNFADGGIQVRGSSPLHALWGPNGIQLASHHAAAQAELERAILEYAPRPT